MNILWQWWKKTFGGDQVILPTDRNIVYSKPGCEHCARAKEFLAAQNISYEERTLVNSNNKKDLTALMKQRGVSPGAITTPQIWFKGEYIGGANELEEYLTPKE